MSKQGEEKQNKSNILSLDSLQKRHEEIFAMEEAYVSLDDEMVSFKYYPKLPESKKNEYIQELIEFTWKTANEEEYAQLADSIVEFSLILVVDKFTDIEIPEDDIQKIVYSSYLSDFGLFSKIIEVIDEEELIKVMNDSNEAINKQREALGKMIEDYESKADNIEDLSSLRLVQKELEKSKELDGE